MIKVKDNIFKIYYQIIFSIQIIFSMLKLLLCSALIDLFVKANKDNSIDLLTPWEFNYLKTQSKNLKSSRKSLDQALVEYREKTKVNSEELLSNKISLNSWGKRLNQLTIEAHLEALNKGKQGRITDSDLKTLAHQGQNLHVPAINNFSENIKNLSTKQIIQRGYLYANNAKTSFFQGEKSRFIEKGYTQARRRLGPCSNHCPDCVSYQTDWTDINNVVPPATDCRCGGRCCCQVDYR